MSGTDDEDEAADQIAYERASARLATAVEQGVSGGVIDARDDPWAADLVAKLPPEPEPEKEPEPEPEPEPERPPPPAFRLREQVQLRPGVASEVPADDGGVAILSHPARFYI
jgi:hypothetical protein